jgi:hypothetical protein
MLASVISAEPITIDRSGQSPRRRVTITPRI